MKTEKEDLTKYDFKKELITMVIGCIGLQPAAAKKKAYAILKKYEGIIEYSESNRGYYEREYRNVKNMFDTLKSGAINYSRGKHHGKLLLKDIEQIEVRDDDVLLTTKTGRDIIMGETFKYLKELF